VWEFARLAVRVLVFVDECLDEERKTKVGSRG
jgi:hypothetical protein